MRIATKILILLLTIKYGASSAQVNKIFFKDSFYNWIRLYYRNLEPDHLYPAFVYTIKSNSKSAEKPSVPLLGFIATALKDDSLRMEYFFNEVKGTTDKDALQSFSWMLWFINSKNSHRLLSELNRNSKIAKEDPYIKDLIDRPAINIYNDDHLGSSQIQMLWYNFFATGDKKAIGKIITKVKHFNSDKWIESETAKLAVFTIRYNGANDIRILNYCKELVGESDPQTLKILREIIADVDWREP